MKSNWNLSTLILLVLCLFAAPTFTGCGSFTGGGTTTAPTIDPTLVMQAIDLYVATNPSINPAEVALIKQAATYFLGGNVTVSGTIQQVITAALAYYQSTHKALGTTGGVNIPTLIAKLK